MQPSWEIGQISLNKTLQDFIATCCRKDCSLAHFLTPTRTEEERNPRNIHPHTETHTDIHAAAAGLPLLHSFSEVAFQFLC